MFGVALRRLRCARKISIEALACELKISPTYLLDVEKERRQPLTDARIDTAARFLSLDPLELRIAAAKDRGRFELPAGEDEERLRLGAELARRWTALDSAALVRLSAALGL